MNIKNPIAQYASTLTALAQELERSSEGREPSSCTYWETTSPDSCTGCSTPAPCSGRLLPEWPRCSPRQNRQPYRRRTCSRTRLPEDGQHPVSYTHLTLPTSDLV